MNKPSSPDQAYSQYFRKENDDALYQFLIKMLHLSYLNQTHPSPIATSYKENCIIKISGLRQIGYSTCIARLLDEPEFNGLQTLILVPNNYIRKRLLQKFPNLKIYDVETFNTYKTYCCSKRYNLIIIDNASLMEDYKEYEQYIINLFDKTKPFYLIMLG